MDLYSLIGFSTVAAIAGFTVKQFEKRIGTLIAAGACALMLTSLMGASSGIISDLKALGEMGGVSPQILGTVLKAVGTAYLTHFARSLCTDLGETGLASAVELTGRVLLLVIALPAIRSAAETVIKLVAYSVG